MKRSGTFLLLIAVLGLGAYILLVDQHRESTPERQEELRRAFRIDPDRTTFLGIRRAEYHIELERVQQEWVFRVPEGARAQDSMVRQTLSRLRGLSRGELITPADMRARGQTLADFGLEIPTAILQIEDHHGRREYRVGNFNPLGTALFVKEENSSNIMAISSDLLEILPLDPTLFRDRRLLPFPMEDLRQLTLRSTDRVMRLERQDQHWQITEPAPALADAQAMEGILQRLGQARIEQFVEERGGDTTRFGFESAVILRAHARGDRQPVELRIGAVVPGEAGQRYARFAGRQGVFTVSEGLRQLVQIEEMALRDRRVLPVAFGDIRRISLWGPENGELRLRRSGDQWQIRLPTERPASAERVERLWEVWSASRIELLPEDPPESELLYRIAFELSDRPDAPLTFAVHRAVAAPGRVWLRPEGQAAFWQVLPDTLAFFPTDALAYQSRVVLQFTPSDVIRVSLSQSGEEQQVTRTAAQASWQSPGGIPNPVALHQLLSLASSLRADTLLPTDPALVPEAAAIRISFGLGGTAPANRTLLLFAGEAEEEAWTGFVLGGTARFTLPADTVRQLTQPLLRPTPPAEDAAAPSPQPE